jgi:UDP-2,4-diacetamido-2,4,6-trideoxy-beta-L-altropyranose hydrolase
MNIVIRADAAVHIGSGHVMRCLTLADELRRHGASVTFICRDWDGHLQTHIMGKGYECVLLPRSETAFHAEDDEYAHWLGVPIATDAAETLAVCAGLRKRVDWCITDHYAIDARWHSELRPHVGKIMVIDDIANRPHDCDLLLDQNLYDNADERYKQLVPAHCRLLLGPE